MYDQFSDRARKVMQLADQEAQRFGKEYISPEHVLLGLCKEGSGVAATVLKNLGVSLGTLQGVTEGASSPSDLEPNEVIMGMGRLPSTLMTKRVIEFAIDEARELNHNYVGTEHILLGLTRLSVLPGESCATLNAVFTKLSLTSEKIREGVKALLGKSPSPVVLNEIGIPIMKAAAEQQAETPAGWYHATTTVGIITKQSPEQFQVGDVVRLKSGGPSMTVREIGPSGLLTCIGFIGSPGEWTGSIIELCLAPKALIKSEKP